MSNSSTSRTPAPFSFAASQYFDGPDGKWSSFVVRAGTPEQSFRVLPSTVTSEVFLPMAGACKEGSPANCFFLRGAELYKGRPNNGFQSRDSSSWHEIGIYQISARDELHYNASGLYGLDTLGLMIANSGGPTLQNQVIAGVVNPKLWVGRLGMDVKPSNFSEFENPQRSLIKTLKDENYIPSLSYGYTAGAYYRKPSAYGSLVYGGYDQSRFVPNNVTFPFDANDSRKPSLHIQSVVSQDFNNTTVSMLPDGAVYSLIDFAEPQMWLPVSACDAFAKAFNLTYDNKTDLYLVDATTRSRLLEHNPTITFGLGNTVNPAERVNVVLPYSAFDQQATYPIYPNETNYFPIRRAYNETQYTIGRTFFQEAYVKIDYDRGQFSVHQALFPPTNAKSDIVPILSPGAGNSASPPSVHQKEPLSKGAVAGISIGSVLLVVLLISVGLWVFWRRRTKQQMQVDALEKERRDLEIAKNLEFNNEPTTFYEKGAQDSAEMEGHGLYELHDVNHVAMELESERSKKAMSIVVQFHEMDNTEVKGVAQQDRTFPEKSQAPPGWI